MTRKIVKISNKQKFNNGNPRFLSYDDKRIYFYSDNKIREKGPFFKGQKQGEWQFFKHNGRLEWLGHYKNNVKIKKWLHFSESGIINRVLYFSDNINKIK